MIKITFEPFLVPSNVVFLEFASFGVELVSDSFSIFGSLG